VLHRTVAEAPPPAVGVGEGYGTGTRPLGLRLLSSIDDIRAPDESTVAAPLRLDLPLQAVLFDMDGTLTLPGQLDFVKMREVAGLPPGAHIFDAIAALGSKEQRAAAWSAIESVEDEAFAVDTLQLQPGLVELIGTLRAHGLRMGIATRNTARSVTALLTAAGLDADTFEPVLTRDSGLPDKPHAAIAQAACARWGLAAEACLMVGDSLDDMRCGRAAGMATCLIDEAASTGKLPPAEADFSVAALAELTAMVADATCDA